MSTTFALDNIRSKAEWVRRNAESMGRYVRMIDDLPPFETMAEEAVNDAELALTEALLAVKVARAELAKKRTQLQAAE